MKDALGIVVGVVITLVALAMTVSDVFNPFKDNQKLLAQSNSQMLGQLTNEVNSSSTTEVSGQSVITFINSEASRGTKIMVEGKDWTNTSYTGSTINTSDTYIKRVITENGSLSYTFEKKS